MKRYICILFVFIFAVSVLSCQRRSSPIAATNDDSVSDQERPHSPGQGINKLTLDLFKQLPDDGQNLVFSPFSIGAALGMTYMGARENTQEEMARVLHFPYNQEDFRLAFGEYIQSIKSFTSDSISLNIANSLWAQKDYHFLDGYFASTGEAFEAPVMQVDFVRNRENVRQKINQWVWEQTREKISDLISPDALTQDTRLVLVNAIYFHGLWGRAFDSELTFEDQFLMEGDNKTIAHYMFREGKYQFFGNDSLQIIELPYAGQKLSMFILLPSEGLSPGHFEHRLDAEKLADLFSHMEEQTVRAYIPRFKAESKINLEETLMNMGLNSPFGKEADFSGMTGNKDLKIDKVIHQAVIEVEETGTEAAAATAVIVIRKTALDPIEPIIFRANRPYLFFIRENEGQGILFAGRVVDPSQ